MVVATFVLAIVMMNIFIGVLGQSYSEACEKREILFEHLRARIVLDYTARNAAVYWLCSKRSARLGQVLADALVNDDDMDTSYIWYCRRSRAIPEFGGAEDDDELSPGEARILAELSTMKQDHSQLAEQVAALSRTTQALSQTARSHGWHTGGSGVRPPVEEQPRLLPSVTGDESNAVRIVDLG
eukprot:gnl/TRDRNA2_/TRDRNA2_170075_c2_seq1.p1 gnl/TRDRNA2_/TRDRNA2_170075_c2~~gnl/TRDRNA2_/TRDRNA2_170075_c2_seq1.p1  ORF type:complete len:196 (-),score=39.79 gnl/TRDRNA2_/TRDRNA2_170075_c2_seq1:44-595(-)